jgi:hypothetical protein
VLQSPALVNRYAAMPSLHAGWNLLLGVVMFRATRHRVVRACAVTLPVPMAMAVWRQPTTSCSMSSVVSPWRWPA